MGYFPLEEGTRDGRLYIGVCDVVLRSAVFAFV